MRSSRPTASRGGVGKTATAVNLAWSSADAGIETLVWDLDPQGAAPPRLPDQAEGEGRRQGPGERQARARRRHQVIRLRPARPGARRLLLPQPRPCPRRRRPAHQGDPPGAAERARRVRRDCPRLRRRASRWCRTTCSPPGRRPGGPAHPDDVVDADLRAAPSLPRRRGPLRTAGPPCWGSSPMAEPRKRLHRAYLDECLVAHPDLLEAP